VKRAEGPRDRYRVDAIIAEAAAGSLAGERRTTRRRDRFRRGTGARLTSPNGDRAVVRGRQSSAFSGASGSPAPATTRLDLVLSATRALADRDARVREDVVVDASERDLVAHSRIACASDRLVNARQPALAVVPSQECREARLGRSR